MTFGTFWLLCVAAIKMFLAKRERERERDREENQHGVASFLGVAHLNGQVCVDTGM